MAKVSPSNPWTKPPGKAWKGKPVPRPQRTLEVQSYIPELMKGMALTMKHFFKNTKEMVLGQRPDPVTEALSEGVTTLSYPEEKRPYPERVRGLHRLTVRETGDVRCVACLCCSTACPAQCIAIEPGEYPEGDERRGPLSQKSSGARKRGTGSLPGLVRSRTALSPSVSWSSLRWRP